MLVAENLTKKLGSKTILSGIDLQIRTGEFITLFGPNGAGKSTLLKILSLQAKPTAGTLSINGCNVYQDNAGASRQIGVISHQTFLYENLTAYENLEFYGRMYGLSRLKEHIYKVVKEVGLEFSLHDRVGTFSRGMQQRLAIARAIVHQPAILFLDEPYTGLDQQGIAYLNGVLAKFKAEEGTVFMITHSFDQSWDLSDRMLIIRQGRIVYAGKAAELSPQEMKDIYQNKVGGKIP